MKRITANHYQTSERYYKLPKLLFESERYKDMKLEVKVAYTVLKDRLELSLSQGSSVGYGHAIFVEKVYPDGSFLISETNVNNNSNYTFRSISSADSTMSFAYTTKVCENMLTK
ncbi:hypothetical protein BN1356_01321 [Streptococcus varani]|uniref:Peptidase C51 domain-containing protein n=1 Tax=Streptococcus varani TaxID=1608583 RepID=A0A0E4CSV0_9STRE|nr:hypothetical protein BN1356_01321 [Streptococcus varani]